MPTRPSIALATLAVLALLASGCGTSAGEAGSVPESAKLAPADAVAFVTLVTDDSSEQWDKADRLLGLFPDAREALVDAVRDELVQEELTWGEDVAPALGDELVVVVTAAQKPVVLLQPESEERLGALLEKSDEPVARETVSGWTALAETEAELDAYRTALDRGTLESVDAFSDAMTALPADALGRGWVDLRVLANELASTFEESGVTGDIGIDWLAAGVTAEDDGVHLAVSVRTPGDSDTSYEPELLERIPADAVVALSFGGTQGVLDRVEGAVDVDEISRALEEAVGVSLDRVLDALSGEGALYVRPRGEDVPEVTLVLAPPDVGSAFDTVDRAARSLARELDTEVTTRAEGGRELHELRVEDVTITYVRVDDRVIATTGATGITDFLGNGPKLAESEGFTTAAERVELGDRTRGLAYVDLDGLIPLVEGLAGPEALPAEAREVLETLDSFVLQASGDGPSTTLSGFLRVTR